MRLQPVPKDFLSFPGRTEFILVRVYVQTESGTRLLAGPFHGPVQRTRPRISRTLHRGRSLSTAMLHLSYSKAPSIHHHHQSRAKQKSVPPPMARVWTRVWPCSTGMWPSWITKARVQGKGPVCLVPWPCNHCAQNHCLVRGRSLQGYLP